jgi:NDP-sugar pyrophosphorylase family protein
MTQASTTPPIDRALILAAGLGTRLRPLTNVRAKPAIPVGGEPLIRRIVRWLAGHQVTDIVVNLHHRPETIAAVLGDGFDLGARVRYSWEQPAVLGSAGGPRRALPILGADTFYIVNGDTLTDLDLSALGRSHLASGATVTLALTPNHHPDRYGGVRLNEEGAVVGFAPKGHAARGSFHFIGVQAASASVFRPLPDNEPSATVGGLYDRAIADAPGSIRGFICDASFHDIGTVADYVATSRAISPHASGTIAWDDVQVDPAAALDDCIVTDGVRVPAGARYRRQILFRGNDGGVVAEPWSDTRD